jgi:hypothetical protein
MNLKRWFAWTCLALVVVAEICLFSAYRERDTALTGWHNAQIQARQLQDQWAALTNSDPGLQAAELLRLRKQNEILAGQVASLHASLDQVLEENRSNAQHLATARTALQLQQAHLRQLQTEKQQIAIAGASVIEQNSCGNNLRQIDAAKLQWALEKDRPADSVPTVEDLLPYLKSGLFPACPAGGTYSINAVGEPPTCSIPGHGLAP